LADTKPRARLVARNRFIVRRGCSRAGGLGYTFLEAWRRWYDNRRIYAAMASFQSRDPRPDPVGTPPCDPTKT
jgi:hypothetical protein